MFLSNPAKFFLASIPILFFLTGCGFRQNDQAIRVPLISETESQVPFPTKEPENYQCEIVVNAGGTESRTFTARLGEKSRIDYNFGGENQLAVLYADKNYLIDYKRKIYAEKASTTDPNVYDTQFSDLAFASLNRRGYVEFEEIGRENGLIKYEARINEGGASEVLIYVDENRGMPIKQEFFSLNGEERILQYSVELRNLKLEVDESLFEIPRGFRKVSVDEFHMKAP